MKKHIILTGKPVVGKTTVIKKIIPLLGMEAGGFFTEVIKKRVDITLIPVNYENRETLPEKVVEMLKTINK